ncbi:hypothetical protein OS493_037386 [Desmophyllum pertusum]|uniref:Major facilitator superfamily (MFS) profile domain-containing protein n=1 Tax=Desmophyllum pertusum TaxID=174260 RepID=A0A9W9ZVA7_9CNID|nr:hypothetical protein OS493_037386 [Desmophyllum pertusum]
MFLVGITFLLVLLLYKDHPMATVALSLCGYIFIDCTWVSVYLITSELFPTVLRNTGQGTGSTTARIGGILAPYIALMGQLPGLSIAFPVVIFAVVANACWDINVLDSRNAFCANAPNHRGSRSGQR